mgnify:CR=1 FL=1
MSLTNTTVFTLTRDDVLNASARATGYLGQGETLSPEDKTNRSQALNIMIKFWATSGLALWVTNQIVMPLVAEGAQAAVTAGLRLAAAFPGDTVSRG